MNDKTRSIAPTASATPVAKTLDEFLAGVERRAYKQALYAVRNEENALDIVQDAMLNLVQSYRERPAEEWPLLFTRILQNAIHNHFRRHKVRDYWTPNFSQFDSSNDEDESNSMDVIEAILSKNHGNSVFSAEEVVKREQILNTIEGLVKNLPARQREAFLLRYWEDLSVSETAETMGCSEGSVKTHCSRATHALAQALSEIGITGSI